MERRLVCAKCGLEEDVDIERIFSLMDGKPDGRKKLWKIRWVENSGPEYICPDESYEDA